MAAGDWLSSGEQATLDATIRRAEQVCRAEFSVYVGSTGTDDARTHARRLHQRLVAPDRSVLLLVDPTHRALEVVVGSWVRRTLTDGEVQVAVLHMQHDFAQGDLLGGLRRGIEMLAEHARPPRTLHAKA